MNTLLFLCSGNYYRSRFAEHLFNHLAGERSLPWVAFSRALSNTAGSWKTGPISPYALAGLRQRSIRFSEPCREPLACLASDLASADRIIALKELEHRPLIETNFPDFAARIEYWHIHDIDVAHPDQALAELENLIHTLLLRLNVQHTLQ